MKSITFWQVFVGFNCYGNYYNEDDAYWVYDGLASQHKRVELHKNGVCIERNYPTWGLSF